MFSQEYQEYVKLDYRKSVSDSMNTTKLDSSVTLDNKKSLLKEDTEWDVRYTA